MGTSSDRAMGSSDRAMGTGLDLVLEKEVGVTYTKDADPCPRLVHPKIWNFQRPVVHNKRVAMQDHLCFSYRYHTRHDLMKRYPSRSFFAQSEEGASDHGGARD